MQPALFDTSIYIAALRRGNDAVLAIRRLTADSPLWLSAVVLEELYVGVSDRDRHILERLERDFDRAKRILVPNLSVGFDWHSYKHFFTGRSEMRTLTCGLFMNLE